MNLASRIAFYLVVLVLAFQSSLQAGTLDRAGIAAYFPPPLVVGERDPILAVWPVLKQQAGSYDVIAYVYESVDLAPLPGFGGTPPDLLIALAPDGAFADVKVLSQHEPVFVDGLGPEPLFRFVEQYVGLSVRNPIRVGRPGARAHGAPLATVVDGVSMATASTRVINETILTSALAVARKKLGFGAAGTQGLVVRAKPTGFEPLAWDALLAKQYVQRLMLTGAKVDQAFAGTSLGPIDETAGGGPFLDLYTAYLNVPRAGQNILGAAAYAALMRELGPNDHAIMVLSAGRWNPLGDDFVLGSSPDRIGLAQDGFVVNARDMAIERRGQEIAGMPGGPWTILKVAGQAGFDPSKPWTLIARVAREKGQIFPEKFVRDFSFEYSLPVSLFERAQAADQGPAWTDGWRARWIELAAICLMISALVPVLIWQKGLVARSRPFAGFRLLFLSVTLVFLGYYAQAQLSIVTLVGTVRAIVATGDFHFLLYDPPSLVLWVFVLASAVVWGRGTFCGWLCPFGALQEFLAWPARLWRIPQIILPRPADRALRGAKYVVLAAILTSAAVAVPVADHLVEVEPFKAAITLGFVRSSPFVAYAILLLLLNLFCYKAFCRYLCPLGAALAVLGCLRVLDWIPRRSECGSPCQLCRVKCRYDAIQRDGKIVYGECFQCMDCVTIIENPDQCVPQILERKKFSLAEAPRERMEVEL